ncbi:MAG TPA: DinB family protein [Acidisarcina sp.]
MQLGFENLTSAEQGSWREGEHSWSVAEHLDHLATTNAIYISAMNVVADRARAQAKVRRGPAKPGFVGRMFVRMMEPPVRPYLKFKAPRIILPSNAVPVSDALARFVEVNQAANEFLATNVNTDLNSAVFKSPLAAGVWFSLASGLNILAVHNRRHLWHTLRVHEAGERAGFSHSRQR